MQRLSNTYHYLIISVVFLFLFIPVIATFIYAIAGEWGASILPTSFSWAAFSKLAHEARFYTALGRTLLVSVSTLVLAISLILPLILTIHYYFPRLKGLVNIVVLLPFIVPPVVSSVGLLELYADGPLTLVGTPWILIGGYFVIVLPFIYRAIDNNLQAINLADLIDTAQLLGASKIQAVYHIVIPNLRTGLTVAFFLGLSFLIGEFVFANILAGGSYETLQVYLYSLRDYSGHYSSAVVISYFLLVMLSTIAAFSFKKKEYA